MKTKLRVLSAVVAAIIFVFCVLSCACNNPDDGNKPQVVDEPKTEVPFTADWMKYISDEATLNSIAMPGSHNSATKNVGDSPIGNALGQNQNSSVYEQLLAGVRYLDLRVSLGSVYDENGEETQSGVPKICHNLLNLGYTLEEVLTDVKRFSDEHTDEIIIIDFQKVDDNAVELSEAAVERILDPSEYAATESVYFGVDTIGGLRQNNTRFVILFSYSAADWALTRYYNLVSYYREANHCCDGDWLVDVAFPSQYDRYTQSKLFVLQAQCTLGLTENSNPDVYTYNSFTDVHELEKSVAPSVNAFVRSLSLAENAETLAKTNIIMRDYVLDEAEKTLGVIALNLSKNLVKAEYAELFAEKTAKLNDSAN